YFNFFIDNIDSAFSFFGSPIAVQGLEIVLPVGISFYTFQTLSYSIDVYKRKLAPTSNFISFAAFVSFFPQLVAGPIERATNLLPQFYKRRTFNYEQSVDGLRQILWGLFKKMVIADNAARLSNEVFNNSQDYSGASLFLGAFMFAFQIYGDFSGYSDIAIGTSRLFGFDLKRNFAFPYFSRDVAEFWRRWHISLSTWFRDYLYIPLGGSKGSLAMKVRNTFIIFIVSGFWHGANWTFIVWGALNALYFLPLLLTNRNRKNTEVIAQGNLFPNWREGLSMFFTFILTVFTWVFFRAENLNGAFSFIYRMMVGFLDVDNFKIVEDLIESKYGLIQLFILVFFVVIEWLGRENEYAIETTLSNRSSLLRWSFYSFIIFLIGMFMVTEETPFIYFQF
ncbi:MAG: D-alanyl-lipoteichoic acid acyltransferase DltB (MBOAT superfamily), partial [Halieaceae bacterium]